MKRGRGEGMTPYRKD
jgi:hypothetical protein